MNKFLSASILALGLIAPGAAQDMPAPLPVVPAGEYKLDKSHATLTFVVNHLGFSNYHAQFTSFDATMTFDPAKPADPAAPAPSHRSLPASNATTACCTGRTRWRRSRWMRRWSVFFASKVCAICVCGSSTLT